MLILLASSLYGYEAIEYRQSEPGFGQIHQISNQRSGSFFGQFLLEIETGYTRLI
jgi:hypothetical protein